MTAQSVARSVSGVSGVDLEIDAARPVPRLQPRQVRVVIADARAFALEHGHDVERRRFAQVVDIALVRNAQQQHRRSANRFRVTVQRVRHLVNDMMRHRAVHVSRELDEASLEPDLLHLPRQIKRVDGDAVAAQAGARVERHEPERLRGGRLDHLPHADAEAVAHERKLVHEPDVDGSEGVLEELHHLGDFRRAHLHHRLDAGGVEEAGERRAVWRQAAHDLRDVARVPPLVAGVHALWRKRQEEVLAGFQPAAFEDGLHDLLGRPGIRRRLEDHEHPGMEVVGNHLDRGDDVGQVRVFRFPERRGHADVDRVEARYRRGVRRRDEPVGRL